MSQQHFWNEFYGWSLALGFILVVILVYAVSAGVAAKRLSNPFGPFIRAFERSHKHHQEMARIRLRAKLARQYDPDYVKFLEEKDREP